MTSKCRRLVSILVLSNNSPTHGLIAKTLTLLARALTIRSFAVNPEPDMNVSPPSTACRNSECPAILKSGIELIQTFCLRAA